MQYLILYIVHFRQNHDSPNSSRRTKNKWGVRKTTANYCNDQSIMLSDINECFSISVLAGLKMVLRFVMVALKTNQIPDVSPKRFISHFRHMYVDVRLELLQKRSKLCLHRKESVLNHWYIFEKEPIYTWIWIWYIHV